MKEQKGITLIFLVLTIILIILLAAITVYTGTESYEKMKIQAFVAKMITIQEAVDKLCEEYTVSEINEMGLAHTAAPTEASNVLAQVIENSVDLNSWSDTVDNNLNNYRYFDINNINTILGIKNFDTAIWVNPTSRNVIAVKGVRSGNETVYRQYDLTGGQSLPEPNINVSFSLSYSVKTYENKAEIILLKNSEETIFSEVKYYKQKEGTTEYSDAKMLSNISKISLTESGVYKIEATDSTGNTQSQEGIIVTIVNKPLLVEGMTPVKFNASGNMTTTTVDDKEWYNYGENVKNWANVKLKDGSIYVWIPRFAYQIDTTNKEIDVKFLKEFSQIGTDGKAIPSTYKVAPAFQDGTGNGFANGEWDASITGFWVAKYETTNNSSKPQNISVNLQSWRSISPKDAFDTCRKMESDYITNYFDSTKVTAASGEYSYGEYKTDNNNIDTHLMKNSEWGAVAYLSHSKYGAGAGNINKTTSYYIQENTAVGFSSTNNYTGIYGLSGGTHEVVAAGMAFVYTDSNGAEQTCYNSENKSTKYATLYATSNATADENKIYGDAMKETSGWFSQVTNSNITNLICRGAYYNNQYAGIFAYTSKVYNGSDSVTFRPVLIVEY